MELIETIGALFQGFYNLFFGDLFIAATWQMVHGWPYENEAVMAWFFGIMSGFISLITGPGLHLVRATDEKLGIEKEPPKSRGDIAINPNSLVIKLLHFYFGTYPRTSCEILLKSVVMSFGVALSLQFGFWSILGFSALIFYHLPNNIYTLPSTINDGLSSVALWIMGVAVSIGNTGLNVIYFLVAPAILGTILFLVLLLLFRKQAKKSVVFTVTILRAILKKVCYTIEYT